MRDSVSDCTETPALDFLRKEGLIESASAVFTAISAPSDILFRLYGVIVSRVFVYSFPGFCFFTVPCPESRSEALRFFPGEEVEAEGAFLRVACSFFQLLERLFVSIPTVLMSAKAKTSSVVKAVEELAANFFFDGKKEARAVETYTAFLKWHIRNSTILRKTKC